jgi:glycine/D-amino acid oxidase-like deaminating enzyme
MSSVFDVSIVGAGIIGAACAFELSAREGLRVAVIEAGPIGGGATAEAMGHIVVMDDSEAQFALTGYSQKLWLEIADELPADNEYDGCGTIWVAADDEEMAEVFRKQRFYTERGVSVEILDAKALVQAEPNLREGFVGGLRAPADSVIYPPCAARFFIERAKERGAQLFQGRRAIAINKEGVKLNDGEQIKSKLTVNAAGAFSPELTEGLNVQKRKGHLVITERYPNFARHQLIELGYLKSAHSLTADSVAFNIQPRKTRQMLIGSSRQYGVTDRKVDTKILKQMLERANFYMPSLKDLMAIRVWTGFRPATPDKLPLVGPHPSIENLYLATGHEGLGITTSLGTARLLADQILGRDSEIPIEPYLPNRSMKKEVVHA